MSKTSNAIRPSATLIVVAPIPASETNKAGDCDFRVLMMKRNAKSSFVNAHVFPGGNIDQHDNDPRWNDIIAPGGHAYYDEESKRTLAHKICAIRETFEEAGLLLTNPPVQDLPAAWREKVHQDASQFRELCIEHKIAPSACDLHHFSNWITPVMEKRRYNTQFFITVIPEVKGSEHAVIQADGGETIQLDWFTPEEALDSWKRGEITLYPPQWYTLYTLKQTRRHQDIVTKAGVGAFRTKTGKVLTVMPQPQSVDEDTAEGKEGFAMFLAYPGDETYEDDTLKAAKEGQHHRLYIKKDRAVFSAMKIARNIEVDDVINEAKANL
ncbi:hypothetical protein K450DRAFT_230351 [Umbelopsis ramanniana AG]|uniref:Nudix hydrolase domain-containing protein n=1 Tax=Umbelopsis ramanniana AG TaxID=1314678 RepID=A0AAD5EEL0_UMBRA|nr:uncharacterized protein K450DRAFT_230351 [Umbelopsis ramanniana AG]KAI8582007.1 hypothetical protein K450DRAFT_230351 [Umbelopsis ramanniana AG]